MRNWCLLLAALGLLATSLLTLFPAPPWVWAWKLAILAGEFGHWLALIPVALLIVTPFVAAPPWRIPIVAILVVALGCFLRPAFRARRIAAALPAEMQSAFGQFSAAEKPFAPGRLYRLHGSPAAELTTEIFSRPEGRELKVDFYRPFRVMTERFPGAGPAARPPCILVIHGGGWDAGDRLQLSGLNHRLAALGYAVASVDYRLAPRWQWPAQREDVLAAVAWLKQNGGRLGFDPANIVLLGRSAGGQIAEVVAYTAHDPAIRGIISFYGPSDMVFGYRNADENDAIRSPSLMRALLGGTPDQQLARYEDASALRFAGPGSPPTLLIHGYLDTLVWHKHDERLAARLAEAGVPHYFLSLPWATHGFDFNPNGPGGQLSDYVVKRFLAAVTSPATMKR